jgi:hypothetical protein
LPARLIPEKTGTSRPILPAIHSIGNRGSGMENETREEKSKRLNRQLLKILNEDNNGWLVCHKDSSPRDDQIYTIDDEMNISFTPLEKFVDSEGNPDPRRMKRHEKLRTLRPSIECYFLMCDLEELRNGTPAKTSKLRWNGKSGDFAELFGILFDNHRLTLIDKQHEGNREEFFRVVASLFVDKSGNTFSSHVSESFRRLSCPTYGREPHYPGLKRDLLNSTKSKR